MPELRSLPGFAEADRQTIEEIAEALPAGWPVEEIVVYGSKRPSRRCRCTGSG